MSLTSDADAASGVVELLGGFPNQSVQENGVLFFPTGHHSRTSAHHTRNFHYRHARSGKPQSGRDLLLGPIASILLYMEHSLNLNPYEQNKNFRWDLRLQHHSP